MITRSTKKHDSWRNIDIPGGSLRVQVRRPTFSEKSRAHALSVAANTGAEPVDDLQSLVEHRLRSTIVGWSDVQDEQGNPVPFSWDELQALTEQNQPLFYQLLECANDAFAGAETDAEKNSVAPSSDSPVAMNETATPSMDQ